LAGSAALELDWESQNDVVGLNESQSDVPLAVSFDAALGLDSQSDVTESQKEGVFLAGSCVDVELDLVSQKEEDEVLEASLVLGCESQNEDDDDVLAGSFDAVVLGCESQNDVVGLNESQRDDPSETPLLLGCVSQKDDVLAGSADVVVLDWESQNDVVGLVSQKDDPLDVSLVVVLLD